MNFLKLYALVLFTGIIAIIKRVLSGVLKSWQTISMSDKVLLLLMGVSIPFIVTGWRGYRINFSQEYSYFHRVITDDLVVFLSLKCFIFVTVVTLNFLNHYRIISRIIRYLSTMGLVLIYLLNYFSPDRITPNQEAAFTWQFYQYGLTLIFILISSFLGTIIPRKHEGSLSPY